MVPSSQNKSASDRGNGGDWSASWSEWGAGTSEPAGADGGQSQDVEGHTRDTGGRYGDSAGRDGDARGQDGNATRGDWNGGPGGDGRSDGRNENISGESGKADDATWSTSGLTGENHGQTGENGDGLVPAGRGKQGTADNTIGRARDDNAQTADAVPPPEATHRYYWTEVPRFKSMWSEHESAWPKDSQPAAKIDRSGDPPGSWRSDSNLFLSAEKHDRTKEAISEVHGVESRVTEDLRQIKDESPHNADLVGLEFRRKGEDRLKEKVAEFIRDNPDAPPNEVVQDIPDAIRYTFSTQKESYTTAFWDLKERLESHGYEMYHSNNSWDQAEYKGVNTRWTTPEGQRFEIQFHTAESHHAKQEITHQAYERIRNPLTSKAELQALKSFQREVSSWVPVPQGATDIPSFRKKGY